MIAAAMSVRELLPNVTVEWLPAPKHPKLTSPVTEAVTFRATVMHTPFVNIADPQPSRRWACRYGSHSPFPA